MGSPRTPGLERMVDAALKEAEKTVNENCYWHHGKRLVGPNLVPAIAAKFVYLASRGALGRESQAGRGASEPTTARARQRPPGGAADRR